jgi:hypothetical protein
MTVCMANKAVQLWLGYNPWDEEIMLDYDGLHELPNLILW